MTNEMIARIVNNAVDCSIERHCTAYIMSDGENLIYTCDVETYKSHKNRGYWVAAIFENGHRVES